MVKPGRPRADRCRPLKIAFFRHSTVQSRCVLHLVTKEPGRGLGCDQIAIVITRSLPTQCESIAAIHVYSDTSLKEVPVHEQERSRGIHNTTKQRFTLLQSDCCGFRALPTALVTCDGGTFTGGVLVTEPVQNTTPIHSTSMTQAGTQRRVCHTTTHCAVRAVFSFTT